MYLVNKKNKYFSNIINLKLNKSQVKVMKLLLFFFHIFSAYSIDHLTNKNIINCKCQVKVIQIIVIQVELGFLTDGN